MAQSLNEQRSRINQKLDELKRDMGPGIDGLLAELNRTRLNGKGTTAAAPAVEKNGLRWTLAWSAEQNVSYELNVVIQIEDTGKIARVSKVWIHRRVATPIGYEGHTPTTKMLLIATLSIANIREAILLEWP